MNTLAPLVVLTAITAMAQPSLAQFAGNVPEAPEPNDSVSTASILQCGRQGVGTIGSPFGSLLDCDLWCFTLSADQEVVILVSARNGGGGFAFDLRDATGAILFDVDEDLTCTTTSRCFSRLRTNLTAGTYYVQVVGGNRVDGVLSPAGGNYALDVACMPMTGDQPCASFAARSEIEPNFSPSTATTVSCCDEITGAVLGPDTDYFRLDVSSRQTVTVDFDSTQLFPLIFPRFLAADGTTQIEAFTQRIGSSVHRVRRVLEPGTYYVQVVGPPVANTTYTLRFDCQPITGPYGAASQTVNGSACSRAAGGPWTFTTMTNEVPVIGTTYSIRIDGPAQANGAAFVFLSPRARFSPELDLTVLGAPGCLLAVPPDLAVAVGDQFISSVPVVLRLELFLPNTTTLLGSTLSAQGVLALQEAIGTEFFTTDVLRATLGNYALD